MGCIHSVPEPKDSSTYIETLTLKRRVTKKKNGENVKISISVIADQTIDNASGGDACESSDHQDDETKGDPGVDNRLTRERSFRTVSYVEGRRFVKFPNMQGYKMCRDCNEHKNDVLKTKTKVDEKEKEICRKCSVKTRKKKSHSEDLSSMTRAAAAGHLLEGQQQETTMAKINISAFASLLALTALDLTAPANEALLKNRKNTWIQLAGHPGAFAPAGPNTIWKKRHTKDNSETVAYEQLMEDSAHSIVPMFYREVEYNSEYFIEIEDLLQHFNDPNIMDIKMGTRTFLESEVQNTALRKDLYEKMIALDPSAPTQEEQRTQSVTKLRYMQFREQESSTSEYGFRIEALRTSGEPPNTNLKKVKSKEQIREVFAKFIENNRNVQNSLVKELGKMRKAVEGSSFFMTHEIIGSSILIIYDKSEKCGTWLIDFSKTSLVDEGCSVNHRSAWENGNREDGFLYGLDNLMQFFTELEVKEEEALDFQGSRISGQDRHLT